LCFVRSSIVFSWVRMISSCLRIELYTSDLNLDYDKIEVFSVLRQLSFTSYGKDTFSSISILIDSLCAQPDYISKQAADNHEKAMELIKDTMSLIDGTKKIKDDDDNSR